MIKLWVTAIVVLFLFFQHSASAQESQPVRRFGSFTVIGDQFPDAAIPMTPLERLLFIDVKVAMERISNRKLPILRSGGGYNIPKINSKLLRSVKINKQDGVLVNFDKAILRHGGLMGLEDYLQFLRNAIEAARMKRR